MPSSEFAHWMAFEQLEPFGGLSEDRRAGVIASTVFNMNRSAETKPRGASDFFPSLRDALRAPRATAKRLPKLTAKQEAAFLDAAFGFK